MAGYYTIPISLTLESPFLLSGLGASAFGIDAAPLRDGDGPSAPLLMPGPQVRGVLRHAVALDHPDEAKRLFGKGGMVGVDQGALGRLVFGDLEAQAPDRATITRVAIDPETGAAKDGHLLTIELPAAVGEEVTFEGEIRLFAESNAQAQADSAILRQALPYIVAIGKFKTAGYGRLTNHHIGDPKLSRAAEGAPSNLLTSAEKAVTFDLRFSLDRLLLVDTDYPELNFMRSATVIPGSVLKGTLARQLARAGRKPDQGRLAKVLSHLQVGFARKSAPDGPLQQAVRMRVAISQETGAAAEGQLFSQSLVKTEIDGTPVLWQSRIHWPGGDAQDLDDLRLLLGTLGAGLVGIGKTGATMADGASLRPDTLAPVPAATYWKVELLTPALMLRVCHLRDQASLEKALNAYWDKASGGTLRLAMHPTDGEPDYCATQSLRGGFSQTRFAPYGSDTVEPFVLVKPSSYFVLEPTATAQASAARLVLEGWRRTGLPAAHWTAADVLSFETPQRWQENPFLPENGYGEARIAPADSADTSNTAARSMA